MKLINSRTPKQSTHAIKKADDTIKVRKIHEAKRPLNLVIAHETGLNEKSCAQWTIIVQHNKKKNIFEEENAAGSK